MHRRDLFGLGPDSARTPSGRAGAIGQGSKSAFTSGRSGVYSVPLANHLHATFAEAATKLRSRTHTRQVLNNAASAMRMYAHHLDAIGVGRYTPPSRFTPATEVDAADAKTQLLSMLRAVDASWSAEELTSFHADQDIDFTASDTGTYKYGVVPYLHDVADHFFFLAQLTSSQNSLRSLVSPAPHLSSAVFSVSHLPHLIAVQGQCAAPPKKQPFCAWIANPNLKKVLVGLLVYGLKQLTVTQLCALDAITSVVTDVVTDGAAVIATPLEVAVCAAAQAAFNTVPGALVTAGVVSQALDAALAAAGC